MRTNIEIDDRLMADVEGRRIQDQEGCRGGRTAPVGAHAERGAYPAVTWEIALGRVS